MAEFKELYTKSRTYGDLDRVIDTMSDNALIEMRNSMKIVQDTTGLDMKQETLLMMVTTKLNYTVKEQLERDLRNQVNNQTKIT